MAWRTAGTQGIVVWGMLAAIELWLLAGVPAGEVRHLPPAREVASSLEIFGDRQLVQTFVARADGLAGIVLFPRAGSRPSQGRVDLELEGGDEVVRASVPAGELARGRTWTWRFPPLTRAADRRFWLRVRLPEAREGQGLAFAIGPNTHPGRLYVGEREQWGDLVFSTVSTRAHLWALLRRGALGGDGVAAMVAVITGFAVLNLALAVLAVDVLAPRPV